MTLRAKTREIIDLVEEKSGIPVRVTKDPALKTLANVRMARGNMPVHLVTYNPKIETEPDYLICYQCGFILRLFDCPPSKRFSFAAEEDGWKKVEELIAAENENSSWKNIPEDVTNRFCRELFDGLMLQIRSVPVGLRVDTWLRKDYPELKDLQEKSTAGQLEENREVLSPDIKKVTPAKVYEATLAMNAAFSIFWDEILNEPRLSLPFKATKYWEKGKKLMEIWKEIPSGPGEDYKLVNSWADELTLSGWYRWIPYSNA